MLRRVFFIFFVGVLWLLVVRGFAISDVARLSYEHRDGREPDDQVERGNAQVIRSPVFTEGIRLACWAGPEQAALASAIYYFDIPASARSIKIRIPYVTEEQKEGIGGGVWIRRAGNGAEYFPDKQEYEATRALYGDTFVIKNDRYLEVIEVSALEHRLEDGRMELHIIAEGSQCIDVRYIEVEAYDYPASERVVKREYYSPPATERVVERYYYSPPTTAVYVDYPWWSPYRTYWYWYIGPVYTWEWIDGYWVRVYYSYPYPRYHYYSVVARDYWDSYYVRYSDYYVRWVDVYRAHHHHRSTLVVWDRDCESVRREYVAARASGDPQRVPRERIRSVLASHKQRRASIGSVALADRTSVVGSYKSDRTDRLLSRQETTATVPQKTRREEPRQKQGGLFATKTIPDRAGVWDSSETSKARRLDGVVRTTESSDRTRSEAREDSLSGLFAKRRAEIETRRLQDSPTRSAIFSRESRDSLEVRQESFSEPQKVRRETVRREAEQPSRSYSALGRETSATRSAPAMKQRTENIRASSQPQVIERREVRTEVRSEPRSTPTPVVKQRSVEQRSVERSARSAPSRQDDEEKEKRQSSGGGSQKRRR